MGGREIPSFARAENRARRTFSRSPERIRHSRHHRLFVRRSDLRNESSHLLDLCCVSRGYRSGLGLCLGRTPLFLCISHADKKRIGFFGSSPPAKTITIKNAPRKALRAFRGVFYFPPAYFRFSASVRCRLRPLPSPFVIVFPFSAVQMRSNSFPSE